MASTSYNTLTLGEEEPRKARNPAVYVVLGLAVVAMAGVAALMASSAVHTQSVTDAAFLASAGDQVVCDKKANNFLESLPKYDPELSSDPEAFYNACYYSFRCCTTTGNSAACYVSENFGASCRDCLQDNAPRMTKPFCVNFAKKEFPNDDDGVIADAEANAPAFTIEDIMAPTFASDGSLVPEKLPQPQSEAMQGKLGMLLSNKFASTIGDFATCWPQAGSADPRVKSYSEKCFEVLSWCNLLCPRDAANSVEHKMCKHCTLFGYKAAEPTVKERTVYEAQERAKRVKAISDARDEVIANWNNKWSTGPLPPR